MLAAAHAEHAKPTPANGFAATPLMRQRRCLLSPHSTAATRLTPSGNAAHS